MATKATLTAGVDGHNGDEVMSVNMAKKSSPVYTYSREELLAWADIPFCKRQLDGLDPNILRATADAGDTSVRGPPGWGLARAPPTKRDGDPRPAQDLPEWRKDSWRAVPTGSTPPGLRRRISDDEPGSYPPHSSHRLNASSWENSHRNGFERGVGNSHGQGLIQGGGNRWDHRGGNGERGFRPQRDIDGIDTGDYGQTDAQSRRGYKPGWNSEYGDGVPIRGGRGRDQANETGAYARSGRPPDNFYGRSLPASKAGLHGHRDAVREDVGFYDDDETFGSILDGNEDRIEQEKCRRESFELMREEARRQAMERKPMSSNEPQTKHNAEDSIWDGGISRTSTVNPSKAGGTKPSSMGKVKQDGVITVPPGFSAPPGFEKIAAQIHSQENAPVKVETSKSLPSGAQSSTRWGDVMELEESMRVEGISDLGSIEAGVGSGLPMEGPARDGERKKSGVKEELGTGWSFESMFGPSPFLADRASSSSMNTNNSGSTSVLNQLFQKANKTPVKRSEGAEGDGRSKFARWFNLGEEDLGESSGHGAVLNTGGEVNSAAASATILSLLGRGSELEVTSWPSHPVLSHGTSPPPMPVAPSLEDIENAMAANMATTPVKSRPAEANGPPLPVGSGEGKTGVSIEKEGDDSFNWVGGKHGRQTGSGQRVVVGPGVNGAGTTPLLPKVPAMMTVMEIERAMWEESVGTPRSAELAVRSHHPDQHKEEKPNPASQFLMSLLKKNNQPQFLNTQDTDLVGTGASSLTASSAELLSSAADGEQWKGSFGHSVATAGGLSGFLGVNITARSKTGVNDGSASSRVGRVKDSLPGDEPAALDQNRAKKNDGVILEQRAATRVHVDGRGFSTSVSKHGLDGSLGVTLGGLVVRDAGVEWDDDKASKGAGTPAEPPLEREKLRDVGYTLTVSEKPDALAGVGAAGTLPSGAFVNSTLSGSHDSRRGQGNLVARVPESGSTGKSFTMQTRIGHTESTAVVAGGEPDTNTSGGEDMGSLSAQEASDRLQTGNIVGQQEVVERNRIGPPGFSEEVSVVNSDPAISLVLDRLPASRSLAAALMLRPQTTALPRPGFASMASDSSSPKGHSTGDPKLLAPESFTPPSKHVPPFVPFDSGPPPGLVPSPPFPGYFQSHMKRPLEHQLQMHPHQATPSGFASPNDGSLPPHGPSDALQRPSHHGHHVDNPSQSSNSGMGRPPFSLPHPMMGPPPGGLPFHHMGPSSGGYMPPAGVMGQRAPYYPMGSPYVQVGEQLPHMPPPDLWVQQHQGGGVFRSPGSPMQLPNPIHDGPVHRPLGQMPLMQFLSGGPSQFPSMLPGKNLDFRPPSSFPDRPGPGPTIDQWFGGAVPVDLMARIMRPPGLHGHGTPISGPQSISIEELEQKLRVASA